MAGKLIEYPFDTVKVCLRSCFPCLLEVRLQTQPDVKPLQFRGPLDCFRQTFHNEGLLGFYKVLSLIYLSKSRDFHHLLSGR